MNIAEELLGKEVINDSGNLLGVVKDVTWNFESNIVESLIVKERGGFSLFGSGEKKIILYENIHSIGDKILVNINVPLTAEKEEEEEKDEFGLNRLNLKF